MAYNQSALQLRKRFTPFNALDYLTGVCTNEDGARQHERYLKSGMGKKYLRNRLKKYFGNL